MKKAWGITLVILILITIGAWGLSTGEQPESAQQTARIAVGEPNPNTQAPKKELPILSRGIPAFEGIASWINSEEITPADLEGKVVLVDFWTYTCINCIRTMPYIEAWWSKYQDEDFIMIGVHTPEFGFEKKRENVIEAAAQYNLKHPIAQDNDYVTWKNFNNRFWPAKYLFDKQGNLRYKHFGEGKYEETEAAIQQLLGANMELGLKNEPAPVNIKMIKSPETYFGYWRDENFSSNEDYVRDEAVTFTFPETLNLNQWAFEGDWTVHEKYSQAEEAGARFRFRYSASIANLVMAIKGEDIQDVAVYLDGKRVPDALLGKHVQYDEVDEGTFVLVSFSDLFELIAGEPGEHLLEIETLEEGLQIYAITFG